jgi:hypothetical protein
MILNLNAGSKSPQRLRADHKQKMVFKTIDNEKSELVVDSSDSQLMTDYSYYVQTSRAVNLTGGENIDITGIDDKGETVYMSVLIYQATTDTMKYFKVGETSSFTANIENFEDRYIISASPNTDDSQASGQIVLNCEFIKGDNNNKNWVILPIEIPVDIKCTAFLMQVAEKYPASASDYVPFTVYGIPNHNDITVNYSDSDEKKVPYGMYYAILSPKVKHIIFSIANIEEPIEFNTRPIYLYTYALSDIVDFDVISGELSKLDKDGIFDCVYAPLSDTEIENPLEPKSYFSSSHIWNKYVIPQISTINIKVTNKRS